jgi:hypothetical protein
MNRAYRLTTRLGQRLWLTLGVGALIAMAMLPFFLGASKSDTGSSTTVIAAPTIIRTSPSAVPNQIASPFGGGWGSGPFTGGALTGPEWWLAISAQASGHK